tara:strand:+ start:269 stop:3457 length:3189 start_codon:yes stop_codon:yes gene_type:complete
MTIDGSIHKADSKTLDAIEWRCIGPPRGGRVVAVAGDPVDPATFYFGGCAGGIWKTDDGGTYWENISDGFLKTSSVGAIAVSESDPNVIYAGMGEACIRLDVSYGDGVYRSTDRGKTWTHLGLSDTRHIGRVRVHPKDPDTVYVAALGHAFGPNKQRGVFRTTDGGKNWEQVLFKSEDAGAIDISMDPNNPRILYSAFWQVRRDFWSLNSGGPGSGLHRSMDGGTTWTDITQNPGLPKGIKGRIGVAVSPAKPGRVWATIDAEDCGVYRSDDGGNTWELLTDNSDLQGRPWYYSHIFADPKDPETVWLMNFKAWKSIDGGVNFTEVTTPHGDNHDLWIDPNNTQRMVQGNDGGACVSFNGGESWSTIYNQLTSQFYHVTTDDEFPYKVYATQQDNSAITVPSRSYKGAIPWGDCYPVGSSESGHIVVDPKDSNIVISGGIGSSPGGGGNLLRYDHSTGQTRLITVWPEAYWGAGAADMKYRFQWTFPIQYSPHDPSVLYVAANVLFKSVDEGSSWEKISPDLTRADITKLGPSGGPIVKDASGAETYATIFAFTESPHEKGVFWAGSDDGLVHISRDSGKNWKQITPNSLPEWTLISMIEPSAHDKATAYMACTRYKLDDNTPMLFKTDDYGETWTDISDGIPEFDYTRVIREDPIKKGLLYAGTETGVYVSFTDGREWQSLQPNVPDRALPVVPIHDMVIKNDDLVVATHGRSFWIMDDLTQVRQIPDNVQDHDVCLFKPRTTHRLMPPFRLRAAAPGKNYQLGLGSSAAAFSESKKDTGEITRRVLDGGQNPPAGVMIFYWIKEKIEGELTLQILDSNDNLIKRFSNIKADESDESKELILGSESGVNRFVWDMRYPEAVVVPEDKATQDALTGPLAPPGLYKAVLTHDEYSQTQDFEILKDPRVTATQEDLMTQFELLIKLRDSLSHANKTVNDIRNLKTQVTEWVKRAEGTSVSETVFSNGSSVITKLESVEREIVQIDYKGSRDMLNLPPKLNLKFVELINFVAAADYAPPKQAYEATEDFNGSLEPLMQSYDTILEKDLSEFENLIAELEIPSVSV